MYHQCNVRDENLDCYAECSCGWKSRTYANVNLANIAKVAHESTMEFVQEKL